MGILSILFWLIGLLILHLVIKSAIDNSETAENIRVIRRILSSRYPNNNSVESEVEPMEPLDVLDLAIDECPACHSKVQETDRECLSCGLTIEKS